MSKAFTSEETELPPEIHARPPPAEPKPLDEQTRERLNAEGIVRPYAHVTLEVDGERAEWHLVQPDEADPAAGRLSIDSPLGRVLLGKSEGDDVRFVRPKGPVDYELISVKY